MTPLGDRFWLKVDRGAPGGCWLWIASLDRHGYGKFWFGRKQLAHRVAYESLVGPIPTGLQIDHLCRVRACVNPAHLEPVTQRENILRGEAPSARAARATACPKGHPYDVVNTQLTPRGDRRCRECNRQRAHTNRALRRQEVSQ